MKPWLIVIVSLILFMNIGMAQTESKPDSMNEQAKVVFYRLNKYEGSAIKMKILCNDQPVIRLDNSSYYSFMTQPGDYYFSCKMGVESRIRLSIEPGKTYYIKCYINTGFWSGIPQIELVDAAVGHSVIEGGSLKVQEYEPVTLTNPKSRLGLTLGGGGGFEKVDLFVDENNDDVTLSSGGGFAIGAKYGYEISKHYDISFDLFYQGSTLSRTLDNADASFERMIFTVTPALIIPIKKSDYYRFKVGFGLGNYSLGKMYIDASEAGGEEMTFRYESSFGGHGCISFESYMSDRFSMSLGLKYYNVYYRYKNEGSSHETTYDKIKNPDGSGIDFSIGYYYHF